MFSFLKPAAHKPRLPAEKIDRTYTLLREQVFLGTFIGYAGYYLVRKNFNLAMPFLLEEGYNELQLGIVASATALAYGISKFVMGNVSDRSNARIFLPLGLILTSIVAIIFGCCSFATSSAVITFGSRSFTISSVVIMYLFIFASGWFQGMGWAPCGRSMVHWFTRSERGLRMAIWNVAHNVGGGLLGPLAILSLWIFGDKNWHSIFYFPAFVAIAIAIVVYLLMRDTPQSCGLPPIEEFKNEFPEGYNEKHEKEFTTSEIFLQYILPNRFLWCIAIANAFVYLVRYGVIDWAPTYLTNAKDYDFDQAGWAYFLYEFAGIPGTLLCGWISDRFFKGRRAPASMLFMGLIIIFILMYWLVPPGYPWAVNLSLIAIGFLIYGPVMMIGLHALELVPKKAAGTSAGLTGLFGYFFGTSLAGVAIGHLVKKYSWDSAFYLLLGSCVLSIFFIGLTWNADSKERAPAGE